MIAKRKNLIIVCLVITNYDINGQNNENVEKRVKLIRLSFLMIGHDLNLFLPKNEVRVSFEYDDNTMEEIISITALYVREHLLPVINQVFYY
jgi:hypothetical protein